MDWLIRKQDFLHQPSRIWVMMLCIILQERAAACRNVDGGLIHEDSSCHAKWVPCGPNSLRVFLFQFVFQVVTELSLMDRVRMWRAYVMWPCLQGSVISTVYVTLLSRCSPWLVAIWNSGAPCKLVESVLFCKNHQQWHCTCKYWAGNLPASSYSSAQRCDQSAAFGVTINQHADSSSMTALKSTIQSADILYNIAYLQST